VTAGRDDLPWQRILCPSPRVVPGEDPMTTELRCLVLTALLTGTLWVPVVIGYVSARGPLKPVDYVTAPTTPLPDWVNRANRAHLNAVESFAPFAAVTLAGYAVGVSTPVTAGAAVVYLVARVAHAVVHLSGVSTLMARTVLFTVGWGAFVTLAIEILRHAG
jgi:uncharacterized MAPEG superfamily protein